MRIGKAELVGAAAVAATTGVISVAMARPWIDWLFLTVMSLCLGAVAVVAVRTVVTASREGHRAAAVRDLDAAQVRAAAVAEERRRLDADIAARLRASAQAVRDEVDRVQQAREAGEDPRSGLRRIHRTTQTATAELRRQLGLLRSEDDLDSPDDPRTEAPAPLARWPRTDLAIGAAAAALAAVEVPLYLAMDPDFVEWSAWSAAPSALAAATIAGRRAAPVGAALACALVFVTASAVGVPVGGGFWLVVTLGGLTWSLVTRVPWTWGVTLGLLVLSGSVVAAAGRDDPQNLGFDVILLVVAAVAGLVTRAGRAYTARARAGSAELRQLLDDKSARAVRDTRVSFAREIHDVVSHSVGLTAMQASAAEVSWPHDPAQVDRAIAVIRDVAEQTLADLERLAPAADDVAHGLAELEDLVERIRGSGTEVSLTVLVDAPADPWSRVPDELARLTYRIVQEGLTNALRHAPGARVAVEVRVGVDELQVSVADDGPGFVDGTPKGFGLTGVAERVGLAGGELRTGPGPAGGFRIEARLPVTQPLVGAP